MKTHLWAAGISALILSIVASAQAPSARPPAPKPAPGPAAPPARYGPMITTEQAEIVMAAAQAEAKRLGAADDEAIAIVEPTGDLILFWRGTEIQWSAFDWSYDKARTSARFMRSTKVLADELKTGSLHPLAFPEHAMVAGEGGEPIKIDGKIVGAIGTTGKFEEQVALAGVNALK